MHRHVYDLQPNALAQAERFVVLVLDQVALILTQQEITALEPVLDVQPIASADVVGKNTPAGKLVFADGDCFVYALDSDLQSQVTIPQSHRICALLTGRNERYALTCKEVRLLPHSALTVHEIPQPLMQKKVASPVKWLVVNDGQLLLGTTAAALFAHVSKSVEAEIISFDEHARRTRS